MFEHPRSHESPDGSPFGRYLRVERTRVGWSQKDLAEAIGVSQQTVSAWERDHTRPSEEHLAALSSILESDHLLTSHERERSEGQIRHLSRVPTQGSHSGTNLGGDSNLPPDLLAFRSALVERVGTGEPLTADEIRFFRSVARQLFGIDL